jgi:hypothetical protein
MTRQSQKNNERFFAERAADALQESWRLCSSERPDFIVQAGHHLVGLEVSQVVTGSRGAAGSVMMMEEGRTRLAIDKLRLKYESIESVTLNIRFCGDFFSNLESIVPALIEAKLGSRNLGDQITLDIGTGLQVCAMRAFHPEWYRLEDRVGLVDQDPLARLEQAIQEKASYLAMYQTVAGHDVRLLLVANRLQNSGKMIVRETSRVNLGGFSTVYFLAYPGSIFAFKEIADSFARTSRE